MSELRVLLLERRGVVLESADGLVGARDELLAGLLGFFDGLLGPLGLLDLKNINEYAVEVEVG